MSNYGYERMLEINTAHNPSDNELNQLAKFMTQERKKIPAGYTYLGQFIDHDMSLDSAVGIKPWKPILSSSISNQRTPYLNLETIYGFENHSLRMQFLKENSNTLLRIGDTKGTAPTKYKVFAEKDLPRIKNKPDALIVDKRNDENLVVAQTQVAFMRFHNAVVRYLNLDDTPETFNTARSIVIKHYQWIILTDYLPRIIKKSVLNDVLINGNQFYFPTSQNVFIPLEFSFATFRFGHSMIRNSYNWNRFFNDEQSPNDASLAELTKFTGDGGLGGENQLFSDWAINWNWFYKTIDSIPETKFNYAEKINTEISLNLRNLRGGPSAPFERANSLPALDLYRAKALGLPSGQEVAKRILGTEERILKSEQIANLLPANLKYNFSKETPLWFYLLADAEIEEHGQTLGEVGSRIIAETFARLIKLGKPSIFDNQVATYEIDFKPIQDFFPHEKEFGMPQLLKFGKTKNQDFDELNPLLGLNKF